MTQDSREFQFVLTCHIELAVAMLFGSPFASSPRSVSVTTFQTSSQFGNLGLLFWCRLQVVEHLGLSQQEGMPIRLQHCQIGQNPLHTVTGQLQFNLGIWTFAAECDEFLIVGERRFEQLLAESVLEGKIGKLILGDTDQFIRGTSGQLKACFRFAGALAFPLITIRKHQSPADQQG